jgi:hypothetical protein
MVEPLIRWEPALLRRIGFVLAIVGVSVLVTRPLFDAGVSERARFVLAATLAVTAVYSIDNYPLVTDAIVMMSAAMAVLVPLAVCIRAYRLITRA